MAPALARDAPGKRSTAVDTGDRLLEPRVGASPPIPPRRWRAARLHPTVLAAVAADGAPGAVARYELGNAFAVGPGRFPWTTFWVNVSGTFVLGALLTLVLERWPPTRYVRLFAAIGFLGAYTTFSTFMVESATLVKDGYPGVALGYVLTSLLSGLGAVYVGAVAGRVWPGLRAVRKRRSR